MALALHQEDEPEAVANHLCSALDVSHADCKGLRHHVLCPLTSCSLTTDYSRHILVHARKSVRAYLYTGVPSLPEEQRVPVPRVRSGIRDATHASGRTIGERMSVCRTLGVPSGRAIHGPPSTVTAAAVAPPTTSKPPLSPSPYRCHSCFRPANTVLQASI